MLKMILTVFIGYLLGSISTGVVLSRLVSGKDIRSEGSGNAGTTNMLRIMGRKMALFTFIGDMLKGIIAVLIQITQEQYAVKRLKAVTAVPRGYEIYDNFTEKIEPVLYCAIPFILICIGSKETALISSFFLLFLVVAQEIGLEKSITKKFDLPFKIVLGVVTLAIFIIQVVFSFDFSVIGTMLLYTFGYELITMVWIGVKTVRLFRKDIKKSTEEHTKKELFKLFINKNKTIITVHAYFTICMILSVLFVI